MDNSQKQMIELQNHFKEFGFIFQGSEIYGGLANTWDYGPLGTMVKENIKQKWLQNFIFQEPNNFLIDSKILMSPQVWAASGHIANFSDPLIENKVNGKRYRADQLINSFDPQVNVASMSRPEMEQFIAKHITTYENSKTDWSKIRDFNLMFQTNQGVVEDKLTKIYLRPETAQGIFINFKNIQRTMRAKIPFGVGQIGKAFRNEVTTGNYIFRTREFEMMELEYFVTKQTATTMFNYYVEKSWQFMEMLGINATSLRKSKHRPEALAHYSRATTDIEFKFPFGWGELMGIADRGDFDLTTHEKHSKTNLHYLDPHSNDKFLPHVIEPSVGLDRLLLAVLVDSYTLTQDQDNKRIILKLDPSIAPYQVAILPLIKKHNETAKKLWQKMIKNGVRATYEIAGSIGKRYRRQDAIGTPFAITVIDQTATTGKVTIRNRDTMAQEEIHIDEIQHHIQQKIGLAG